MKIAKGSLFAYSFKNPSRSKKPSSYIERSLDHNLFAIAAVPESYGRMVYMTDCLLSLEPPGSFGGGELIVGDLIVESETVSRSLFNKIRSHAFGQTTDIIEHQVTIFDPQDRDHFYDLFLLALLGGWDARYIPAALPYSLAISHDGFVDIAATNRSQVESMIDWLVKGKFDVRHYNCEV